MKELFHNGNDFSAASVMDIDYETLSPEAVEALEYIKRLMREPWEQSAQERGLGAAKDFGKDNPLIALQGSMEDLVSGAVYKLLTEHPENAAVILSGFDFTDPDIDRKVDEMLHTAMGMTMDVMDYDKLVQVMKDIPTEEDFSGRQSRPRIDFFRKWNHSRTKTQIESLDAIAEKSEDNELPFSSKDDVEAEAVGNIRIREFWMSLSDADKKLLELKMSGMTTQEIANELGLKTHSAVIKRLQKLKKKYKSI